MINLRALIYARQSLGKLKSITDQIREGEADAAGAGYDLRYVYQDGSSASRYARKKRDDWEKVIAAITKREVDVVLLWEASRGSRDLADWVAFVGLCQKLGVLVRIVADERTYDPARSHADWKTLIDAGVDAAYESEKISARTKRGAKSSAASGRPPVGPCPDGFRREYDSRTGKLIGQFPDPARVAVVVEVFTRVAKGDPIRAICADLTSRGVPTATGLDKWRHTPIRKLCLNVAYIGLRGDVRGEWEPLIDEATFYKAGLVLSEPSRRSTVGTRPGASKHLLSNLATCDECEGPIRVTKGSTRCHRPTERKRYQCEGGRCCSVNKEEADSLIEDLVFGRLSSPDLYKALRRSGAQANVEHAKADNEIAVLRKRLADFRASAFKGETTPATLAEAEAHINADIERLERARDAAAVPSALAGFVGPREDVEARWRAAPVQARRTVLRSLMTVRIKSTNRVKGIPIEDRIVVEWL